jgi:hypothetical protein
MFGNLVMTEERSRMSSWRFWGRASVPPALRDCLAPYGLMLVPTALAALLGWRWWVAALLAAPGFGLYLKESWSAARARGAVSQDETGQWLVGVIGAPIAVGLAGVVKANAADFSALVFVCYLILVVDPFARIVWHWRRR